MHMYQFSSLETTNNKKKTHNKQHNIFSHGFTDLVPSDWSTGYTLYTCTGTDLDHTHRHTERDVHAHVCSHTNTNIIAVMAIKANGCLKVCTSAHCWRDHK